MRCVVRDGGHIYMLLCVPYVLGWRMLVPIESKQQIYVDLGARQRLQNTSARPKENFKLEFERHGVNVEDDNDFSYPPNVRRACVGPV